ncbi:MAG: hypothetical protein ACI3XS_05265 [Eubacteriales bacterium]
MAEFFDKVSRKIGDAANYAAEKTEKFVSGAKLTFELKKEEADLDYCFEKLGRAFFAQARNGVAKDGKIAELIAEADERSEKIKNLKIEIAKAKNKKICPHCSSIIENDAPYCSKCGSKIVADEKKQDSDTDKQVDDLTEKTETCGQEQKADSSENPVEEKAEQSKTAEKETSAKKKSTAKKAE